MKRFFLASAVLFVAACSQLPDDAVAAALLNSPENPRLATCLSVLGSDPSAALISKLRAANRTVESASKCTKGPAGTRYVGTKPAERVSIVKFKRINSQRLEIEFSSYAGALAASGWLVTLDRENGRWVVHKSELGWIS